MKTYILLILLLLPATFSFPRTVELHRRGILYTKDLVLFIQTINSESVGQSFAEKLRTGSVILNRLNDPEFPKTLRQVIYQKKQFKGLKTKNFKLDYNSLKGRESIKAGIFLYKYGSILPRDIVYFHNPKIGQDKEWMAKIKHKLYIKGDGHWYFRK